MKRFTKNPNVDVVVLPGVGRVSSGMILEGDEYARFAPSLLIEVPAASPPLELRRSESVPLPVSEPSPPPASPVLGPQAPHAPVLTEQLPVIPSDSETNGESTEEKRPRGRPRKAQN